MGILVPKKLNLRLLNTGFSGRAHFDTRLFPRCANCVDEFHKPSGIFHDAGNVVVAWQKPERGSASFELRGGGVSFYARRYAKFYQKQHACMQTHRSGEIEKLEIFTDLVTEV